MPAIVHPADEVVISMRPVSVFANGPECELEQLRGDLHRPGGGRPPGR